MNKFKIGQKVYALNGEEAQITNILSNEYYLVHFEHGFAGKFKENLIFESEEEFKKYKDQDADKRLQKLEDLKDYVSKYGIDNFDDYGTRSSSTNSRVLFSNGRMASILWRNDISKFSILPADSNGYFDFNLFENVHSEFDVFDGSIICDTESEIIDALEIVRTAIPFEDLEPGDVFKAYIEDKKEWQSFIIAEDSEFSKIEMRVVNLSVGTYWKMDDPDNFDQLKYVLKLGNVNWARLSVQFSSLN